MYYKSILILFYLLYTQINKLYNNYLSYLTPVAHLNGRPFFWRHVTRTFSDVTDETPAPDVDPLIPFVVKPPLHPCV